MEDEDAVIFAEAFEYKQFRTENDGAVRTMGILETFDDRNFLFTAALTEDNVTIDWIGEGHYTGVELDRDELEAALLAAGVPSELSDGQFALLQAAYDQYAHDLFKNAWGWDDDGNDKFYMDDEYVYFCNDIQFNRFRDTIQEVFGRYERRVESDRFEPEFENLEELTPLQLENAHLVTEAIPKPTDIETPHQHAMTGRLVKENPMPDYRLRALEIHLQGLIPIKEAQAVALYEEGGEDLVAEQFGDNGKNLLQSAEAYLEKAAWMVENV